MIMRGLFLGGFLSGWLFVGGFDRLPFRSYPDPNEQAECKKKLDGPWARHIILKTSDLHQNDGFSYVTEREYSCGSCFPHAIFGFLWAIETVTSAISAMIQLVNHSVL